MLQSIWTRVCTATRFVVREHDKPKQWSNLILVLAKGALKQESREVQKQSAFHIIDGFKRD